MPQPNADHIVSPPAVPGQPYDAQDGAHSETGIFQPVMHGGACNPAGQVTSDFEDSAPFMQT
jgi:hypothetical protein